MAAERAAAESALCASLDEAEQQSLKEVKTSSSCRAGPGSQLGGGSARSAGGAAGGSLSGGRRAGSSFDDDGATAVMLKTMRRAVSELEQQLTSQSGAAAHACTSLQRALEQVRAAAPVSRMHYGCRACIRVPRA